MKYFCGKKIHNISRLEGTNSREAAPWVDQYQVPTHVMGLKMTAQIGRGSQPSFCAVLRMNEGYAYVILL